MLLSFPTVKINSGAPYFTTPIDSLITIDLGTIYELTFPTIKDPDSDLYSLNILGLNSIASFSEY